MNSVCGKNENTVKPEKTKKTYDFLLFIDLQTD